MCVLKKKRKEKGNEYFPQFHMKTNDKDIFYFWLLECLVTQLMDCIINFINSPFRYRRIERIKTPSFHLFTLPLNRSRAKVVLMKSHNEQIIRNDDNKKDRQHTTEPVLLPTRARAHFNCGWYQTNFHSRLYRQSYF